MIFYDIEGVLDGRDSVVIAAFTEETFIYTEYVDSDQLRAVVFRHLEKAALKRLDKS